MAPSPPAAGAAGSRRTLPVQCSTGGTSSVYEEETMRNPNASSWPGSGSSSVCSRTGVPDSTHGLRNSTWEKCAGAPPSACRIIST
jgi:hypothetical protein